MELKVTPWSKDTAPSKEDFMEQFEEYQDLQVYNWSSPPDGVFAGHTHGYHKILYVLDGAIKFDLPTQHQSLNLKTGDQLDLPAGVRHSAIVGMDGVKCLEAHIY